MEFEQLSTLTTPTVKSARKFNGGFPLSSWLQTLQCTLTIEHTQTVYLTKRLTHSPYVAETIVVGIASEFLDEE